MALLRVKSAGPGRRRCLTSVYERAPASHGSSLLSLLSHVFFGCCFFFSPRYTQTVTHTQNLWRTCNGRVRACARSHCVVTFRLARDEGMLLPLTHLMICLLFFFFFCAQKSHTVRRR